MASPRLEELAEIAIKFAVRDEVVLQLQPFVHLTQRGMFEERPWEIHNKEDFTSACRALSVAVREEVMARRRVEQGGLVGWQALLAEEVERVKEITRVFLTIRKVGTQYHVHGCQKQG